MEGELVEKPLSEMNTIQPSQSKVDKWLGIAQDSGWPPSTHRAMTCTVGKHCLKMLKLKHDSFIYLLME